MAFFALVGACAAKEAGFLIRDGDRVVIYGDSITAGEWYPAFIEAYLLTRYPQWRHDIRVRGVGGDKLSNLERFRRDAVALRPDVLTVMMSYNDAGFQRLNEAVLRKYLESIREAVGMIRQENPAARLIFASDPINELAISDDSRWVSRRFYPFTLVQFARSARREAEKLGVPFLNVTEEYGKLMALGHAIAPGSFGLSRDGVHPQMEGQFFIACLFLEAMGATPNRGEVVIDAAQGGRVRKADGATINDLRVGDDGSIAWSSLAKTLPFPVPEPVRVFAFLCEPDRRLCEERLVVTGLSAPAYELEIDGEKIGKLPAAQLAEGVNLSQWYHTPMMRQSLEVLKAAKRRQEVENRIWGRFIVTGKIDNHGNSLKTAGLAQEERNELEELQKELKAVTELCYQVNQPRVRKFRLVPLAEPVSDHQLALTHDLAQAVLDVTAEPLDVPLAASAEAVVRVRNVGGKAKTGEVRWLPEPGWELPRAPLSFRLEPGEEVSFRFPVARSLEHGGAAPQYEVRWRWSEQWPFLMSVTQRLPLRPHLTIPQFSQSPQFSGRMADWRGAAEVVLDQVADTNRRVTGKQRLWGGPDDLSARLFLAWSKEGLLVAAQVRDERHSTAEVPGWSGDLLHLYAVVTDEKGRDVRCQFGVMLLSSGEKASLALPPKNELRRYTVTRDDAAGTTFYELLVPWEVLKPFQAVPGATLRLNVVVNDLDEGSGKGFTCIEWTAGINYGNSPELFPVITLGP